MEGLGSEFSVLFKYDFRIDEYEIVDSLSPEIGYRFGEYLFGFRQQYLFGQSKKWNPQPR